MNGALGATEVLIGSLCVWRITHLLNAEDGPAAIFVRLRRVLGDGYWGELFDCFNCLSLLVAVPFAILIGGNWQQTILVWLASSGGACLLERVSQRETTARFVEEIARAEP